MQMKSPSRPDALYSINLKIVLVLGLMLLLAVNCLLYNNLKNEAETGISHVNNQLSIQDDLPTGKFKVVFSSSEAPEKPAYYISTKKITGNANIGVYLYKDGRYIGDSEDFWMTMDGESLPATRMSNGSYSVKNIRPGLHDLTVHARYYNDKSLTVRLYNGDRNIGFGLSYKISSSKIRINDTNSDYAKNYYKDAIFIDGVDANITFNADTYWNGHQPNRTKICRL
ncbi:MAG: hypothetical protein U9N81_00945 [Bacillota bacterium]|nr:hypothetical protein [Bacillota bacterium]